LGTIFRTEISQTLITKGLNFKVFAYNTTNELKTLVIITKNQLYMKE